MDTNALKTLPEIIAQNQTPIITKLHANGQEFAVVPVGMQIQSLKDIRDEDRQTPAYRADFVKTHDLASFIAHVGRFKSDDTVLFARLPAITGNNVLFSIRAVIDHHPAGTDTARAGAQRHLVIYVPVLHLRAQRWLDAERKMMAQGDFAAFIEDNLSDLCVLEGFTPPFGTAVATPADLLTLSRGLEVRVNQTVRNATRLATGEVSLTFTTENTRQDGSELIVPEWFGLRVPVFAGAEPFVLPVRLRYKVADGAIKFAYLFHDFDRMLEDTVRAAIDTVRKAHPDLHIVEGSAD
ncbi:MAG: DUF2303 family protein [Hyphomicrobiaceae bacterium]|nr:MAG: DUF2303 family protein [Hyphomicrobiaceae bacterium]